MGEAQVQIELPTMDAKGLITNELVQVLNRRMSKKGNHAITQVVIHWSNSFPKDATWENLPDLQKRFPLFDL